MRATPTTPNSAGIRLCRARFSTAGPSLRAVRSPMRQRSLPQPAAPCGLQSLVCAAAAWSDRHLTCRHRNILSYPGTKHTRHACGGGLGNSAIPVVCRCTTPANRTGAGPRGTVLIGSRLIILIVVLSSARRAVSADPALGAGARSASGVWITPVQRLPAGLASRSAASAMWFCMDLTAWAASPASMASTIGAWRLPDMMFE